MNIDELSFKKTMASFASGICVLTTCDEQANKYGVTISAFSSLSLKPMLALFCLGKKASSYEHFMLAKHVGISILSSKQQAISQQFASHASINWEELDYSNAAKTNCPIINHGAACMEAEVVAKHDGGDHTIFILKLITCAYVPTAEPLLYFRGNYTTLDEKLPPAP